MTNAALYLSDPVTTWALILMVLCLTTGGLVALALAEGWAE